MKIKKYIVTIAVPSDDDKKLEKAIIDGVLDEYANIAVEVKEVEE